MAWRCGSHHGARLISTPVATAASFPKRSSPILRRLLARPQLTPRAPVDGDLHQNLFSPTLPAHFHPGSRAGAAAPKTPRASWVPSSAGLRARSWASGAGLARGRLRRRRGRLARLGAHHWRAPLLPRAAWGRGAGRGFFGPCCGAAGRPSEVAGSCRRACADFAREAMYLLVASRRGPVVLAWGDGPRLSFVSAKVVDPGRTGCFDRAGRRCTLAVSWMGVRMGTRRRVFGRARGTAVRCACPPAFLRARGRERLREARRLEAQSANFERGIG